MITRDDRTGLTLDERLRLVALEAEEAGLPRWVQETAHQAADLLETLRWDLAEPHEPASEIEAVSRPGCYPTSAMTRSRS